LVSAGVCAPSHVKPMEAPEHRVAALPVPQSPASSSNEAHRQNGDVWSADTQQYAATPPSLAIAPLHTSEGSASSGEDAPAQVKPNDCAPHPGTRGSGVQSVAH
jgi:hypothetical protein